VGKYLKAGTDSINGKYVGDDETLEAEPVKKKVKSGGFGNFDSW
jgi:peptidyl-prolyl cis-trans isomerase-like protein 2